MKLPATSISCRNLIDGVWREPEGTKMPVISPRTGEKIGSFVCTPPEEIDKALESAKRAASSWRKTPIKERCQTLFHFREELLKKAGTISEVASLESGKTIAEARAGLMKGIEVCEYALSLQNLDHGGSMEVSRGVTCRYRREPLGVVLGITPFNFPAMVPLWMYPIAIALGNAFVLKPSEKVPLTSQLIGECMLRSGLPTGVFTIINGGRETSQALIDHKDVKAVAFVGSTPVARSVYAQASQHGKRCLALGGAKNFLIVTPDANPKITVEGIVSSFTGCAGQRCMAASLLVAVGDVDTILSAVKERAQRISLGNEMGALIDQAAYDRIHKLLGRVEDEGGRLLLDGRNAKAPDGMDGGYWMGPSIIEAKPGSEAATTEIFGPVITIIRANNLTEAMDMENDAPYGNATSVFTTNGTVADYVASRASNGMIGINIGVPVPREPFSFGGTKDSKFGHGEITGEGSLNFWSDRKKITAKWALHSDHNWMS